MTNFNDEEYRRWYEESNEFKDQQYIKWYEEQNKGVQMVLNLKLTYAPHLSEENRAHDRELIDAVNDGLTHSVKITTNKLQIERDRKDQRSISAIRGVKLIYQMARGGCLILMGNLSCSFRQPYGGEFFVTKTAVEENRNFKEVEGVDADIIFTNYPTGIQTMQAYLAMLAESPNLVFNLSQFDEFMEIFGFYKTLSGELNNNVTYRVETVSNPYYFVSIDEKEIEPDEENAVKNSNGIVIGYILEAYKIEQLSSELQEKVRQLVDIRVRGTDKELKKIRSFSDNLFLSDEYDVREEAIRQLVSFDLVNLRKEDGFVVLMGEYSSTNKFKYLHLYDMGQKVKLESIDNSLRLINQGASGAASELLEYIIGSKEMPTTQIRIVTETKKKYIERLDDSQKQAFLMATDGSPVSLIKGPPGTGKTYVINAIVQYITKELKEKVVISSQTHVAIDNVLDELMENYDLIIPNRITNRRNKYSGNEIDVTLYKTWAKRFSEHNARSSSKRLAEAIVADMNRFGGEKRFKYSESVDASEYSVIGATTTTSAIGGKKGLELLKGYDWLIIDEVSKCPITEVLRYLPYVKNIIMVGDDFQLAPLLEFTKEEVQELPSYDEDMFEKLKQIYEQSVFAKTLKKAEQVGRLVTLNVNYRSVEPVLNAYNIFYDRHLINMREKVKPQKVAFSDKLPMFNAKDIFFVDVKNGKEAKENTSRYNVEELRATAEILNDLMENTLNPTTVSVSAIFPYAAQIEKFQRTYLDLINKAKKHFKSFEIDTVDAFQGRETDIVLVNTVVTDTSQRNFLNDFRRINVSMSRARDKLFIFGNPFTLAQIEMQITGGNKRRYFGDIIEDIKRYGQMITFDGGVKYELAGKSKIKII